MNSTHHYITMIGSVLPFFMTKFRVYTNSHKTNHDPLLAQIYNHSFNCYSCSFIHIWIHLQTWSWTGIVYSHQYHSLYFSPYSHILNSSSSLCSYSYMISSVSSPGPALVPLLISNVPYHSVPVPVPTVVSAFVLIVVLYWSHTWYCFVNCSRSYCGISSHFCCTNLSFFHLWMLLFHVNFVLL